MVPDGVYWLCEELDSLMGFISGQRGSALPAGEEGSKLTSDEKKKLLAMLQPVKDELIKIGRQQEERAKQPS